MCGKKKINYNVMFDEQLNPAGETEYGSGVVHCDRMYRVAFVNIHITLLYIEIITVE